MELANYASFSEKSKGRLISEEIQQGRSEFQRDRDRIIHSTAFRRLEYKTQVFLYNEGDHYRTRLTHSIEVSQLGRSIARIFKVDEDLTEAICLAHDLGHSPFGHAGEDALTRCMEKYGGFDHNAQTVRILTKLEKKYAGFDGLNLTWETLEGLAKHNGPIEDPPRALQEFNSAFDLELSTYSSLEAQIAAISDDIAYNSHDIEDGIRAGLFSLKDLESIPVVGELVKRTMSECQNVQNSVLVNEIRSRFIKIMVKDVTEQTKKNLKELSPSSSSDIRNANRQIVTFSSEFLSDLKKIRKFLMDNMYKHYKVLIMTKKATRVVKELFNFYLENPECLPELWKENVDLEDKNRLAVLVVDFIAGMTDRYAFRQYDKIFNISKTII